MVVREMWIFIVSQSQNANSDAEKLSGEHCIQTCPCNNNFAKMKCQVRVNIYSVSDFLGDCYMSVICLYMCH